MDIKLLEKICQQCSLGSLTCQPVPLKGGFLHKMYSLFTTKGRYAVKLLNPHILARDTAMKNYRVAEELERILEKNDLPVIPALTFENKKMQCAEGQFFYLYEWYDGKALKSEEIRELHCRRVAALLAQIHGLARRNAPCSRSEIHIDWDFYIEHLAAVNEELWRLLKENRSFLYESQRNGNIALQKLPPAAAICHNDMDSKNVLWSGTDCRIIDLECLCYSSPFIELYETALCWAGYDRCHIDYHLFYSFLDAYAGAGGQLPTDWETLYWSNTGRLEWLEYNLKRSLGMECSPEEIATGISEVKNTMAQVICYRDAYHDLTTGPY